MPTPTQTYVVAPGKVLPHNGEELEPGTSVDLTLAQADNARHLILHPDQRKVQPVAPLDLLLESRRPHAHAGLITAELVVAEEALAQANKDASASRERYDDAQAHVADLERRLKAAEAPPGQETPHATRRPKKLARRPTPAAT